MIEQLCWSAVDTFTAIKLKHLHTKQGQRGRIKSDSLNIM